MSKRATSKARAFLASIAAAKKDAAELRKVMDESAKMAVLTMPKPTLSQPRKTNQMKPFKPWTFPANAIHIALDIETASTEPNAAIVQLAAVCKVGPTYHEFNNYISLGSNEKAGRDISKETMQWWDTQDPELRKRVFGGQISLYEALNGFYAWAFEVSEGDVNRICLWGNGVDFDNVIIKSAFELYATWPFNFRNNHHMRTVMAMVPAEAQEIRHAYFMSTNPDVQAHDALRDAKYQHAMIKSALEYLSGLY